MSARGKHKTLALQENMEVSNKLNHDASIQSVMNQYSVSRSTLCDKKTQTNIEICAKTG
jgi:hypothetical protein